MNVQPLYELSFDVSMRVVTTRHRGFWSVADLAPYFAELAAFLKALPCGADWKLLIDNREYPIQSREVVEESSRLRQQITVDIFKRRAVVYDGALQGLQVKRVHALTDVRSFQTIEEATAWLCETTEA